VPNLTVFVASTSGTLRPYRDAAIYACGKQKLVARFMEDFMPDSEPSIELCRREIDESNVFLLLLGHQYGSRPVGETASFTELEYEYAVERGLRIISFIVEDGFPWPDEGRDQDPVDQAALASFKGRVNSRHTSRRFGSLQSFREDLLILFGQVRIAQGPDEDRPEIRSFDFGGRRYRSPYQLAVAIATSDWTDARLTFGGDERGRIIDWLRDDVGDASFQVRLISRPLSEVVTDERIADFLAFFAPDIPPTYRGRPTDAAGLAQLCDRAADGVAHDQVLLDSFTEALYRSWSIHTCVSRHPECGDGGCNVLADAWAAYGSALATLATEVEAIAAQLGDRTDLVPQLSAGTPDLTPDAAARLRPTLLRAVLDPVFRGSACDRADRFLRLGVEWWDGLLTRAQTGSFGTRFVFCVLVTEFASAALATAQREHEEAEAEQEAAAARADEEAEAERQAEQKAEQAAEQRRQAARAMVPQRTWTMARSGLLAGLIGSAALIIQFGTHWIGQLDGSSWLPAANYALIAAACGYGLVARQPFIGAGLALGAVVWRVPAMLDLAAEAVRGVAFTGSDWTRSLAISYLFGNLCLMVAVVLLSIVLTGQVRRWGRPEQLPPALGAGLIGAVSVFSLPPFNTDTDLPHVTYVNLPDFPDFHYYVDYHLGAFALIGGAAVFLALPLLTMLDELRWVGVATLGGWLGVAVANVPGMYHDVSVGVPYSLLLAGYLAALLRVAWRQRATSSVELVPMP
jgi:hypothetical protein